MLTQKQIMLLLILATPLAGCDSPLKDDAASGAGQWRRGDPLRWRVADDMTEHSSDTLTIVASTTDDLLPGAGVEDYVQRALARNPSIIAAQRRVRRLAENIPQVTSLDDPMFTVAPVGEMAQTAAGEVGLMTSVSQKLPFPGKLDAQGKIAARQAAMAQRDVELMKLSVAADVRRAYWSLYLAQRQIEVITASRGLLEQLHQTARSKYEAGSAMQQDVLRASVEMSGLDNQLLTLRQQQSSAKAMLNSLLDRPISAAIDAPPEVVELETVSLKLDELLAEAARSNPKLAKAHDQIETYRQQLRLARLNRWPDLTVSVTYNAVNDSGLSMAHNGRDQWWLGFGINLPIWQEKRDAAERGALGGMMEGVAELTAAQNRLAFEVQDAMLKVETQQQSAMLFRDVVIPQARQAVEVSRSGYQSGDGDFLSVVENWRKVLTFELMYHQSVAQLEQNLAQLKQIVGREETQP